MIFNIILCGASKAIHHIIAAHIYISHFRRGAVSLLLRYFNSRGYSCLLWFS